MELKEINLNDVETTITKRVEVDDYFEDISFCADPRDYRMRYNESLRGLTSKFEGTGFYECDGTYAFPEDAEVELEIVIQYSIVKSASYSVEGYNIYLSNTEETNLKKAVKFITE